MKEHRPPVGRLVAALPALAFAATFGLFFLDKNREARTVLRSGRGLLAVAAVAVGYVLVSLVLRRLVAWAWVVPVALTAVVLGLAAWIVRPYYVDETVNRRLVTGVVSSSTSVVVDGPSASTVVDSPAVPPTPVRVAGGAFRGIDHEASGSVSLIRTPDGALVVRLERFAIEGVPDPRVHLIRGEDVQSAGGVSLGGLPGNRGDLLDIPVPSGTSVGAGWTVLVWCRPFSVPVANATLA